MTLRKLVFLPLAGLASVPFASAALADYRENGELVCSGAMARMFNKSIIESTQQAWAQVDPEVRSCLVRSNLNPANFADRCIKPDDHRAAQYVNACRQLVERERQARDAEQRRVAAQNEARERERQAAAAARARQEARKRELVAKYGAETADAILAGKIVKDMGQEEVMEVRGAPLRKDVISPQYELWVYADARIAFGNGKVTYVAQ
jgi:hypothetical protein